MEVVLAQDAPPPAAGPVRPLEEVGAEAVAAFKAGDWPKAIANYEKITKEVGFNPKVEWVYFDLAAAYFNVGNYQKAIEYFKVYQKNYAKSPRLLEVTMGLAQAYMQVGNTPEATAILQLLESDPKVREQVLMLEAVAFKKAKRPADAILALEKLVRGDIRNAISARGALMLTSLYVENNRPDDGVRMLVLLHRNIGLVESVVELNSLAVRLGDGFLKKGDFDRAIGCYRTVRTPDEVVKFQQERIAVMQKREEAMLEEMRATPTEFARLSIARSELRSQIAAAEKLLADFQKLPDYRPALMLRMGSAFQSQGKVWESIVVYQDFLDRFPEAAEREQTLYGIVVALAEAGQVKPARERCEEYLKAFPKGPNAGTVGYLMGATALQQEDYSTAETFFGRMLREQPASSFREETMFLLANAKFMQGKFAESQSEYNKYRGEFSKGVHLEEVDYRIAVGYLFDGKFEQAMKSLSEYLQKYPTGAYAPDAKYRLSVCLYAAQEYDRVIKDCQAWLRQYPGDQLTGEVCALLGDSLAATEQNDQAIAAYTRSYKEATTEEVFNYAIFETSKLLQKKGDWAKVSSMFEEFVREKPEHPTVVAALFWIGKAKVKLGQMDEAKRFTADTIKKYIAEPEREAVEQLITQLATLCAKKKPRPLPPAPAATPVPSPGADGVAVVAATPVPTPTPPPPPPAPEEDPGLEMDRLLAGADNSSPTAKARILFGKSEVARLRRKTDEQQKQFKAIADGFNPDDLSPYILGMVGDYLLSVNDLERAKKFFENIIEYYPKSEVVDFGYNGLGEYYLRKENYKKALEYFGDGVDKIAAALKLKDVTIGKAKTLMALNRLAEAKKLFEQVAQVKEWRGESTAMCVYNLGEIEFRQENWPSAIAFYQRVFVAYQKFIPWVAKSYLRSGECFERMGKNAEAIRTYQEMLKNEKLSVLPEASTARRRLKELGQG